MPTIELRTDVALGVAIPSRNARGRIARLGPVVDAVLANHGYPPVIEQLLAEALTLTALLGSLLKEPEGQLTLQAQTEGGPIDLMVCDYLGGELRGYVRHDSARIGELGLNPTLPELFGKGYLATTFDQPIAKERYQGIVPLEGKSLAEAAQSYFAQSEQIPSLVRLAAEKRGEHWYAGGLLLQHLPEGEEGRERLHTRLDHPDWPHVAILGGSVKPEELTDPQLGLEGDLPGGDDADRQLRFGIEQQDTHGRRKPFRLARRPQQGAGVEERVHWPERNRSASSSVRGRRAESGTSPGSQPSRRAAEGGTGVSRATGTPRRTMVTVSPSSASLSRRESWVLASCTVTSMAVQF